jgi:hypothetical protein
MSAPELLRRITSKIEAWRHHRAVSAILDTPPTQEDGRGAVVFSQVCARDFLTYLLAAKSFAHHTGLSRFAVLDDGSLTTEHHDLLRHHLRGIRIMHISEVRSDTTPAGGTWERLLKAVELGSDTYVIQLDSDTLTLMPLGEVLDCVRHGTAFTLTAEVDARVVPFSRAIEKAKGIDSLHIQIVAESRLDCLSTSFATKYIRGCSGFTGLPPGERLPMVEHISGRMGGILDQRWSEWGTEQVTMNLLTANSPDLVVLAPPIYETYLGKPLGSQAKFVHFMGSYRYCGKTYRQHALRAIEALQGRA